MIEMYCTLIREKRRTFEQVPEKFKAAVEARLIELGYSTSGDPITSWAVDTEYGVNQFVTYNGRLYKVARAHTSQDDWTPDVTPSLFAPIGLEKSGQEV